jgi:hypothetical protein
MDNSNLRREKSLENYSPNNNALEQIPELKELSSEELTNILGYDRGITLDW